MLVTLILSASGIGPFLHHAGEHATHAHCESCETSSESHIHAPDDCPSGPGEHRHSPFAPCELCSAFFGSRAILAHRPMLVARATATTIDPEGEAVLTGTRAPLSVRARAPPMV